MQTPPPSEESEVIQLRGLVSQLQAQVASLRAPSLDIPSPNPKRPRRREDFIPHCDEEMQEWTECRHQDSQVAVAAGQETESLPDSDRGHAEPVEEFIPTEARPRDAIVEGRHRRVEVQEERGWKLFFLIPQLLLFRPARGGIVPRDKLEDRLRRFAAGEGCLWQKAASWPKLRKRHLSGREEEGRPVTKPKRCVQNSWHLWMSCLLQGAPFKGPCWPQARWPRWQS